MAENLTPWWVPQNFPLDGNPETLAEAFPPEIVQSVLNQNKNHRKSNVGRWANFRPSNPADEPTIVDDWC